MPTDEQLRRLVVACLDDLETLADRYVAQLGRIEGYAHVRIPDDDLRRTTLDALELILRKAAGMPLAPRLEVVSESVGGRRASQGVPLDVLLQAVRMVFRLLWTELHDRATADQREALDASAVQLWEAIEYHTVRVHAGYLAEVSRMRYDRETQIAVLLSRFLDRDRPDAALTVHVGQTLGVAPESRFHVAAAPLAAMPSLRARFDPSVQLHARNDSVLVLAGRTIEWPPDVSLAVGPVADGLAAVPGAWQIAHELLMAMPPRAPGPYPLSEGWPALVARRLPALATAIGGGPSAGRALHPDLRRTVETYLRTGSLARTAETLFVHRNTVLKRLTRFRALTGLDPAIPWDAATIRIALVPLDDD